MNKTPIKETCPTCKGDGFDRYNEFIDHMTPCPDCGGSGFVEERGSE